MPTLDRRLLIAVAATAMLASGLASAAPARTAADKAYASVDPFIGTGGEGHTYPGATVPFGMVQLSPDTRIQPREKAYGWAAGYRYDDSSIVGFSHTHFSGTGHSDLGDILLMPFTGSPGLERGDPEKPRSGYASRFRHDDEKAEPGYYAVTLDDYKVRAELTTSARAGVHRYAFPKGADQLPALDLCALRRVLLARRREALVDDVLLGVMQFMASQRARKAHREIQLATRRPAARLAEAGHRAIGAHPHPRPQHLARVVVHAGTHVQQHLGVGTFGEGIAVHARARTGGQLGTHLVVVQGDRVVARLGLLVSVTEP